LKSSIFFSGRNT